MGREKRKGGEMSSQQSFIKVGAYALRFDLIPPQKTDDKN